MAVVGLAGQHRQQRLQALAGVADHRNLCGHPDPGAGGIGLDLHHPDLSRLRQVLGVREVGADHEQRVAIRFRRSAQFFDTETIGEDHLPVLYQSQRDSRNTRFCLSLLDEMAKLRDARLVQRVRLLPGE